MVCDILGMRAVGMWEWSNAFLLRIQGENMRTSTAKELQAQSLGGCLGCMDFSYLLFKRVGLGGERTLNSFPPIWINSGPEPVFNFALLLLLLRHSGR